MTIEGKADTDYKNISCTKNFTIEKGTLTGGIDDPTFVGGTATVRNGEIQSITGAKYKIGETEIELKYDENFKDFNAEVTTTAEANKVAYTVTITEKADSNFKIGNPAPTLPAEETSGVSLKSVVDYIRFDPAASREVLYDAASSKTPSIKFYRGDGEEIDIDKSNYTVKYSSADGAITNLDSITNAGEYTATAIGKGIYDGSLTESLTTLETEPYVIKPISFTKTNVKVELNKQYFEYSDSLVIKPEVTVTYNDSIPLIEGTDYELKNEEYSRQIGSHLVTVLGCGNYEGVATSEYAVFPSLLESATFALDGVTDGKLTPGNTTEYDYVWTRNEAYTYRGTAITPTIKANVKNGNGIVETLELDPTADGNTPWKYNTYVPNPISPEKMAYCIITLPEKYASKKIRVEFEIEPKPLPSLTIKNGTKPSYNYGAPVTLKSGDYEVKDGTTTLLEGTDYRIFEGSYENNVNAGKAKLTVEGIGNYSGTSSANFTIEPISVDNKVIITIAPQKLNKSGTKVTNMDDVEIAVNDGDGNPIQLTQPFTSDDFNLLDDYKYNTSAWDDGDTTNQPQVTFEGKRNLNGKKTVYFKITKEKLSGLKWRLTGTSYEGVLEKPTVDLTEEYGYYVDYSSNLPPKTIRLSSNGTQLVKDRDYTCVETEETEETKTITVKGKGDYKGDEYKFTYDVRKRDIDYCDFEQKPDDGNPATPPEYTLKDGGNDLKKGEDKDYTTDYDEVMAKAKKARR